MTMLLIVLAIIIVGIVLISLSKVRSEYKTVNRYSNDTNNDISMFMWECGINMRNRWQSERWRDLYVRIGGFKMVDLLLGVRQSGKTEKLLREANGRKDVFIITHSENSAYHMKETIKKRKLDINKPIVVSNRNELKLIPEGSELWFDEFELCMMNLFGNGKKFKLTLSDYEVEDLNKDFLKRVIDDKTLNSALDKI